MPEILIPPAYSRENGDFPEFRLENMVWEDTPTNEKGVAILSRPPLVEYANIGSEPIRGTHRQDDLFNGDEFVVTDSGMYRVTGGVPSFLGAIVGGGPTIFASSADEVVVTRGYTAYSYNGTDFVAVVMPDDQPVASVTFMNGLFVYVPQPTVGIPPGRYYFSAVGDGRSVNALDYINAESLPDRVVDAMAFGDNLYLIGASNLEVAMITSNPDAPFARIQQRNYDIGSKGVGLMVKCDNAIHVLADDNIVYRLGQVPERVSNHGIEERIKQSNIQRMFAFKWEGHNFLCLRLDTGAWLLDMATRQWSRFTTYGRDTWAAFCAYEINSSPRFGDDETGIIWQFGDYDEEDCGGPFVRVFPAAFPITGSSMPVYNVLVDHNAGATGITTGQGSDPLLDMRFSRDAGQTWSVVRSTRMGKQGETRRIARFGACGQFDDPGAMFEFTKTDPGPLRVSKVRVNDSLSGRGRS